ncbi:MAG: hypothetical protein VX700_08720 [Pseudomonadota bacterium]|nr:hypothetical protein [Pseudomonadota bacterium]
MKEEKTGLLKRNTARPLNSFFFKRGKKLEYLRAGSVFRRVQGDGLVETAEVLSVGTDSHGIPHVRFKVIFGRNYRPQFDSGERMLALKTFAKQYTERVPIQETESP